MLTQEMVMTIKVLYRQGKSIKAIARELHLARNTVRKYIRSDTMTTHQTMGRTRPSKLDPFKEYLKERIAQAHPEWIPATVLFEEIQQLGYQGKLRILSNYVQQFKSVKAPEPIVRFETSPGQQMQVDFTIIRRSGGQPIKAFVATLGYSRASFVYFYDNERTYSWIDGLKRSFEFFGGVPKEVLFDNAKSIMIERDAYAVGEHRWNAQLIALAKDYGFIPRVCKPYRAKTKGKVERFNRYLKQNFIVPLTASLRGQNTSLTVDIANAHIGQWLSERANVRVHGTTKELPITRLAQERMVLLPLPMTGGNGNLTPQPLPEVMPLPLESLQHPLSLYDQLLEVNYGFAR